MQLAKRHGMETYMEETQPVIKRNSLWHYWCRTDPDQRSHVTRKTPHWSQCTTSVPALWTWAAQLIQQQGHRFLNSSTQLWPSSCTWDAPTLHLLALGLCQGINTGSNAAGPVPVSVLEQKSTAMWAKPWLMSLQELSLLWSDFDLD